MATIDDYLRLFPVPSGFNEADYLSYLSPRVPLNLAQQLTHDAHPDLMLDDYVQIADLMRPISVQFFARKGDSEKCFMRLTWILEYILSGYALDIKNGVERSDPYKQIYVASCYLHNCLRGGIRSRDYVSALLVLVDAAAQISVEGQFQVARLIASLVPTVQEASVSDPTKSSTIQLALSLVIANAASELSFLAQHVMHREKFAQTWAEDETGEERKTPSSDSMAFLRQIAAKFFGVSGKLEEIAERFRESGV